MAGRVHMVRRWAAGEIETRPGPDGVSFRGMVQQDGDDLGRLFWSAFGFHGADGFASAQAASDEARATLAGRWGPMIWAASVVAVADRAPVAASVVLRDLAYDLEPLLGFLVTDHAHQRRGIGEALLAETLIRADSSGLRELNLAVAPENPARTLYHRLGFSVESRAGPSPT
jgi:GNAT superfamily N-acetyltransferase